MTASGCIPIATDWTQVAYAITTVLILIAAIWGKQIRYRFAHPDFCIELNNPAGICVDRRNGTFVWFFHLRVVNKNPRTRARVRVCCTRIERCDSLGRWIAEQFPDRLPFLWAYSDVYGYRERVVGDRASIDCASVDRNSDELILALGICPNNVNYAIRKGERIRVYLDLEIRSVLHGKDSVFEVAWNGEWSSDANQMFSNVQITKFDQAA